MARPFRIRAMRCAATHDEKLAIGECRIRSDRGAFVRNGVRDRVVRARRRIDDLRSIHRKAGDELNAGTGHSEKGHASSPMVLALLHHAVTRWRAGLATSRSRGATAIGQTEPSGTRTPSSPHNNRGSEKQAA